MISSLKKSPSVPALLDITSNLDLLIAFNKPDQIESTSDDVYQIPEERNFAEVLVTGDQQDYGDMEEGRKRRHNADPKSWKRNKAFLKRMRGEEYLGYSKPKDRKFQQDIIRQARRLRPTCASNFCKKSKKNRAREEKEEDKKKAAAGEFIHLTVDLEAVKNQECDSVHSTIERKLKNREIHLPSDYVTITKEGRSTNPYEAINVDHEFVKDYARPENMLYKSIRPGRKSGDPQVVDIRVIKYYTMTI
ncbi:unnamed protein product [Parnassius apollo]|uniref:(apollo) hypothetical protein n=1 Tax=Parnassius apollo TaxID=110799 RepID=A0A8S3W7I6_PARAO|nr:unnamed protein product [Parnassius apollo]